MLSIVTGFYKERIMDVSKLVTPYGGKLISQLLSGEELTEAKKRAAEFRKVRMTLRETSDLIMIGVRAFSPIDGFMKWGLGGVGPS